MSGKRFWLVYVPAFLGYILVSLFLDRAGMEGFKPLVAIIFVMALCFAYMGKSPRVVETPHPSADFELENEYQKLLDKNRDSE